MSNLKVALFPEEVYVFTPRGDVRSFPKGATPIDFAYSIHTDIGNKCIGAKVNRNIVPLKYQLQNGDTVEIITQAGHHPSKDWLKFVVTSRAIAKIKNWVKTEERNKSIALGKDLLEKEFRKHKISSEIQGGGTQEDIRGVFRQDVDDLMAVIGYGKISARHIVNRFVPEEEEKKGGDDAGKTVEETSQRHDRRVDHGGRRRHGALRETLRSASRRRGRGIHLAGQGDEAFTGQAAP